MSVERSLRTNLFPMNSRTAKSMTIKTPIDSENVVLSRLFEAIIFITKYVENIELLVEDLCSFHLFFSLF